VCLCDLIIKAETHPSAPLKRGIAHSRPFFIFCRDASHAVSRYADQTCMMEDAGYAFFVLDMPSKSFVLPTFSNQR
jgi:hypothetical protein